ncbi:hypothetical protein IMAU80032_02760 [Lactiplantibacillus plantarum]|nr:hypothetical protein [Lactiplantibacillus plantarum]
MNANSDMPKFENTSNYEFNHLNAKLDEKEELKKNVRTVWHHRSIEIW